MADSLHNFWQRECLIYWFLGRVFSWLGCWSETVKEWSQNVKSRVWNRADSSIKLETLISYKFLEYENSLNRFFHIFFSVPAIISWKNTLRSIEFTFKIFQHISNQINIPINFLFSGVEIFLKIPEKLKGKSCEKQFTSGKRKSIRYKEKVYGQIHWE